MATLAGYIADAAALLQDEQAAENFDDDAIAEQRARVRAATLALATFLEFEG